MTAKHTPGPWRHQPGRDSGPPYVIRGSEGGFALIVWRMEDDERSPRLEATAHLMAGAPDLLLAAMRYLNALDVWDGSNKADRHTERMEGELRAAVAKARGEQQ